MALEPQILSGTLLFMVKMEFELTKRICRSSSSGAGRFKLEGVVTGVALNFRHHLMCVLRHSVLLLHCSPHSMHMDLVPSNFWKNICTQPLGLLPLIEAIFNNSVNSSRIFRTYSDVAYIF